MQHLIRRGPQNQSTTRWRLATTTVGLLTGLLFVFCAPGQDAVAEVQNPLELDSLTTIDVFGPACPSCRVRVDSLFSIGADNGAFFLDPSAQLLSLRHGETALLESQASDSLLVFDSVGTLVRSFGRHGQGPKEFQGAHALASGIADSLLVLSVGRLTAIAPTFNGTRVSTIPISYLAFRFLELRSGQLVFNNYQPRLPSFIVTTSNGDTLRTFGTAIDPSDHLPGIQDRLRFLLSEADHNRFWAAPIMFRYELELWSAEGHLLRRIRRHADWYKPWTEQDRLRRGEASVAAEPPLPALLSIYDDEDGYLWVLSTVPDSRWRRAPKTELERLNRDASSSDLEHYVDTMIELFSTSTGNLCVSERYPGFISGLLAGHRGYTTRLERDGSYTIRVWEMWPENLPEGGC